MVLEVALPEKLEVLWEPKRYKVIYGGRGSGKSWGVAMSLILRVHYEGLRVLCCRELQNSIKESVHKLLSDQIMSMGLLDEFEIIATGIRHRRNRGEFIFEGLKNNVNKIKSMEGVDIAWIEEAHTMSRNSMTILTPTIRKPGSEIWLTFNPDLETDYVYEEYVLNPRPNSIVVWMNWEDNEFFPDELREEMEIDYERDPVSAANVWGGHCRKEVVGALWTKSLLDDCRDARWENEDGRQAIIEGLERVVVAIDPSGCYGPSDKRSDEIGIAVCGRRISDKVGLVLEDGSGKYGPEGWATKALQLFDRWSADLIVAEGNFGGAMVESTVRTVRRNASFKMVQASRGKIQRAEPVSALYQQGKVRHVGFLPHLEKQLVQFSTAGYAGPRSPDRADAAIWGLTELLARPPSAGPARARRSVHMSR